MACNLEKSSEGNESRKCDWCYKVTVTNKNTIKSSRQHISCKTQNILNKDSSKELNISSKLQEPSLQSVFLQQSNYSIRQQQFTKLTENKQLPLNQIYGLSLKLYYNFKNTHFPHAPFLNSPTAIYLDTIKEICSHLMW